VAQALQGLVSQAVPQLTAFGTQTQTIFQQTWDMALKLTQDALTGVLTSFQSTFPQLNQQTVTSMTQMQGDIQGSMTTIQQTMTAGAQAAADHFVDELAARIPPLQMNLAQYAESVKAAGRDYLTAIGAPVNFAQGGVREDHSPAIHKEMRLFAEPETMGEAYIPLAMSKRGRSKAILGQVAGMFGMGLTEYAEGGLTPGGGWQEIDRYLRSQGMTIYGPEEGQSQSPRPANINSLHMEGRARDYSLNNDVNRIWDILLPWANNAAYIIEELFYDPRGGYDEGANIGPIGDHDDHLHAAIVAAQAGVAASGGAGHPGGVAAARPALPMPEVPPVPDFGPGIPADMAKEMAVKYHDSMEKLLLDERAKRTAAGSGSGPSGPAPPGSVRDWIEAAETIVGVGQEWTNGMYAVAMRESGGDPSAINNWDINAQNGIPSKGLMQMIDPTFNAWQAPGHPDIWNPIDNASSAINYSKDGLHIGPGDLPGGYRAEGGVFFNGKQLFDKGGILKPGITIAVNNTGQDEIVKKLADGDLIKQRVDQRMARAFGPKPEPQDLQTMLSNAGVSSSSSTTTQTGASSAAEGIKYYGPPGEMSPILLNHPDNFMSSGGDVIGVRGTPMSGSGTSAGNLENASASLAKVAELLAWMIPQIQSGNLNENAIKARIRAL
jgi:hypothetical protein